MNAEKKQDYFVGIDLGTSTSEISIVRSLSVGHCETLPDVGTQSPIVSSIVAWDTESQEAIVGDAAARVPNCIREIKRKMETPDYKVKLGDKMFMPQQISALILRRLKHTLGVTLGLSKSEMEQPIDIFLTCPAIFSETARAATMAAGQDAGFNVVRLINEPTAAAFFYAVESRKNLEGIAMVFDFGGGTLDMAIGECYNDGGNGITFDVICNYGDPHLGGKDIDKVLMRIVRNRFYEEYPQARINTKSENLLKEAINDAKKELSTQKRTSIYIPSFGIENRIPVDLDCILTRDEFETALREEPICDGSEEADTYHINELDSQSVIDRIKFCIQQMFDINNNVTREEIEHLLFVGGSSYIPLVQNTVLEELGLSRDKMMIMSPDMAVSKGAAYYAAGKMSGVQVSPYGLGIEGHGEIYCPLVPPQSIVPAQFKSTSWRLISPLQTSCVYALYQDLSGKAVSTKKCLNDPTTCEDPNVHDTGLSVSIDNIPPSETSEPRETVGIATYNDNGMVEFEFSIPSTGQKVTMSYQIKPLSNKGTSVTSITIKGIN